jgi:hypothetical protein
VRFDFRGEPSVTPYRHKKQNAKALTLTRRTLKVLQQGRVILPEAQRFEFESDLLQQLATVLNETGASEEGFAVANLLEELRRQHRTNESKNNNIP